jgi:hypothetical protein
MKVEMDRVCSRHGEKKKFVLSCGKKSLEGRGHWKDVV